MNIKCGQSLKHYRRGQEMLKVGDQERMGMGKRKQNMKKEKGLEKGGVMTGEQEEGEGESAKTHVLRHAMTLSNTLCVN